MDSEEIKAAAKEYKIKVKAIDIDEGLDVHDRRYSDINFAFRAWAEWEQQQIIKAIR